MLDSLTIADFEARVGERFTIDDASSGGAPMNTQLVEVTALGGPATSGGRTPFSLVLRGRSDVVLPQRMYRIDHAELGTMEIFVVPIGPDPAGMRYEAIFT